MSVMRVIVLHPYTKFEICRPYCSEDTVIFIFSHGINRDL